MHILCKKKTLDRPCFNYFVNNKFPRKRLSYTYQYLYETLVTKSCVLPAAASQVLKNVLLHLMHKLLAWDSEWFAL